MEILLLITIVIIALAIINFKDYLYNPHKRPRLDSNSYAVDHGEFNIKDDIYQNVSKEDKIRNSEHGVLIGILSKLANSDGNVCDLEVELINSTIEDVANQILMQSAMHQRDEILEILHAIFENTKEDIETLTYSYSNFTKGQYKRRLKLVEYMLALAYADGRLGDEEREVILDVAALLEIENNDFNRMYDEFSEYYSHEARDIDVVRAYEILGLEYDTKIEDIKKKYKELVKQHHPDILQHKELDSSIIESSTKKLQEINGAYEVLKHYIKGQEQDGNKGKNT